MSPNDARDIYNAVWLHFRKNSSYDFFRYNGKLRGRKVDQKPAWDHALIAKQFTETELPFYIAYSFWNHPRTGPRDLRDKTRLAEWGNWKERQKNRVQYLSEELKGIRKSDIEHTSHEFPALFNKLDHGVSVDSFIMIDSVLQITKSWDKTLDDFAYTAWVARYRKWRPFFYAYMPYDRNTFQQIVDKELQ